jgi:hypothetical protein
MKRVRHGVSGVFSGAVVLALLIAVLRSGEAGDFSASARGTAGANFLKLGAGARALSLGGAASAITEDPTALYWNPAALGNDHRREVSFMYASYLESISYSDVAFALPLVQSPGGIGWKYGLGGTLGLEATLLDFGSIGQTDVSGNPEGSYHPRATVLALGYSWPVEMLARTFWFGAAAKYIDFTIADSASTVAADVGILTRPLDRLTLALALQNLGFGMRFNNATDDLPMTLRLGSGYVVSKHWLLSMDVVQPKDNDAQVCLGAENSLEVGAQGKLFLRAGYSTAFKDVDGFAGPSFGVGFARNRFSFDYAFVPMGDLGTTHRASVSFRL